MRRRHDLSVALPVVLLGRTRVDGYVLRVSTGAENEVFGMTNAYH